jgi:hypothetical protein
VIDTALGAHCPVHHLGGVGRRFTVIHLPADHFAALEIDDPVEVEKQALDRSRQPADIPGPDWVIPFL